MKKSLDKTVQRALNRPADVRIAEELLIHRTNFVPADAGRKELYLFALHKVSELLEVYQLEAVRKGINRHLRENGYKPKYRS